MSEIADAPGRISGESRCSRLIKEYALTLTAARYPAREVSSSGFFTSGPLASEWTTMSSALSPKSLRSESAMPCTVKSPRSV